MTKTGMISSLAIVALIGAVAVMAAETGGFTTLLSSITPRPSVDRSQTPISSAAPSRQSDVKQPAAIDPVPAPTTAQLPAPASPAPVSNDSKTAPVTAAEVLVPDAENGTTRTALTADEKEAVARGLKELGLAAANATPSSQSEETATAELNRNALAGSVAEEARSRQLQAQNRQ